MTKPDTTTTNQQAVRQWWASRRIKYNKCLVVAGLLAFLLYAVIGSLLIAPQVADFEITLFTTIFQGLGYVCMMGVANIFYGLGPLVDRLYNRDNDEGFRQRLFNLGYWFSFALPFSIPLLVVIMYV
ncbi:MAG TPA: hypothetical protein VGN63_05655 [Flavisolibacter sp.]|jgi:hypothetical protein|nr:hypothetical protein [Flavisolibacter sp.]